MGDGVGSADLDGDAVNPLNGVGGPGRLDPARVSVVRRGLGGGFGPVRSLRLQVERVEAQADRVEAEEEDQGGQAHEKGHAEGTVEVEGAAEHQAACSRAHQVRTSKQGQAFSHSFGVTLPSPFLSGERSRWPRILAVGWAACSWRSRRARAAYWAGV